MRDQLRTRGIPFVVVDPTGEPLHDTPSIGATNWNGGLTATRHLLRLGHRRIGVIAGPGGHPLQPRSAGRLPGGDGRGGRADRPGAAQPRPRSRSTRASPQGGALLRSPDRPTAIIAGNDLQALGVYQAGARGRLHIPEDLSVVGFDDLPIAALG